MPWSLYPRKRPTISKTTVDLLLLAFLVGLFYCRPLLDSLTLSYGGDAMSLFLPSLEHYKLTVYNGVIPLWNFGTWLGAPFLATFQSSVLYPPQLMTLVFKTGYVAQNFMMLFSIIWLAWGAYLFGYRALQLERGAALLLALIASCCGFVGGHMDHVNQLAAMSWIPWVITEALILLRRPQVKGVLLLALFICLQTLAGHPQYVAYTLVYLFCLIACYSVYFYHRRKATDPPEWIGMVFIVAGIVVGVGLGCAQLFPSAELSQLSVRPLDSPYRMFTGSFPPKHLASLFWGNAFGNPGAGFRDVFDPLMEYSYNFDEMVCYVGIATLCLAFYAILVMAREFLVRAFSVLTLISLILAFGHYALNGFPYKAVMMWFPGAGGFRIPARFLIFFVLSVAVLAALGMSHLSYYLVERKRIRPRLVQLGAFLLMAVVMFDLYCFSLRQVFRDHGSANVFEVETSVIPFLKKNLGDYRIFRLMQEVPYNSQNLNIDEGETSLERATRKALPARLQLQRLQYNLHRLWGVQSCEGYEEGLLPSLNYQVFMGYMGSGESRYKGKFLGNLRCPTPDTKLLGMLNVKYFLSDKPVKNERLLKVDDYPFVPRPDFGSDSKSGSSLEGKIFQELNLSPFFRGFSLYQNLDALPKFIWGDPLRKVCSPQMLDVDPYVAKPLSQMVPVGETRMDYSYRVSGDMLSESEFSTETLWEQVGLNQGFVFQMKEGSSNAYIMEKDALRGGELLFLVPPFPGWVCRWEDYDGGKGGEVPMERFNSIMMRCQAPIGPEYLEFVYEPLSFRLGLFISCCFAALCCSLLFCLGFPSNIHQRKGPSIHG